MGRREASTVIVESNWIQNPELNIQWSLPVTDIHEPALQTILYPSSGNSVADILMEKNDEGLEKNYASRITKYQGSLMLSICDLELVGITLRDGELSINLSKEYFQEQEIGEQQAIGLLKACSIANLVGARIVAQALNLRLANEVSVKRISGIPFLMIYKF